MEVQIKLIEKRSIINESVSSLEKAETTGYKLTATSKDLSTSIGHTDYIQLVVTNGEYQLTFETGA